MAGRPAGPVNIPQGSDMTRVRRWAQAVSGQEQWGPEHSIDRNTRQRRLRIGDRGALVPNGATRITRKSANVQQVEVMVGNGLTQSDRIEIPKQPSILSLNIDTPTTSAERNAAIATLETKVNEILAMLREADFIGSRTRSGG